jgi:hypothetical protein
MHGRRDKGIDKEMDEGIYLGEDWGIEWGARGTEKKIMTIIIYLTQQCRWCPKSQNLAVPQLKLCSDTIEPKLGGVIDMAESMKTPFSQFENFYGSYFLKEQPNQIQASMWLFYPRHSRLKLKKIVPKEFLWLAVSPTLFWNKIFFSNIEVICTNVLGRQWLAQR